MVDKDKKEHFTIIAAGHCNPERVAQMQAEAKAMWPQEAKVLNLIGFNLLVRRITCDLNVGYVYCRVQDVILACKDPFIQPVFDYMPERLISGESLRVMSHDGTDMLC